jgi:hypothetical protein
MAHRTIKHNLTAGSAVCIQSLTRTQIVTLASTNALQPGCRYIANDITWITAGGTATFSFIAVDTNTLVDIGEYESPILNPNNAWEAVIDWQSGSIVKVYDSVNFNLVVGAGATQNYRFGNALVTNNTVLNTTIAFSGTPTFRDNLLSGGGSITISGGTVINNTFQKALTVQISAGTFQNNLVTTNAQVSQTLGTTSQCIFGSSARFTNSGAQASNNVHFNSSNVTLIANNSSNNTFDRGGVYTQTVAGAIINSSRITASSVTSGTSVSSCEISNGTNLNTTGSVGQIFNSYFDNSQMTNLRNIPSLQITYCSFYSYSQIDALGATLVSLYMTNFTTYGRATISAGTTFRISNCVVENSSYIQLIAGTLSIYYSNIRNNSFIYNQIGTNDVYYTTIDNNSRIRFAGTTQTAGRVYGSSISDQSYVDLTDNNAAVSVYYLSAKSASGMSIATSPNTVTYYNSISSNALININTSATGNKALYYCTAESSSTIRMQNCASNNSRVYGVSTTSISIAQMQNTVGTQANLYYSTFSAYYYAYFTYTANLTLSGAFGMGRFTATLTNPTIVPTVAGLAYFDNL